MPNLHIVQNFLKKVRSRWEQFSVNRKRIRITRKTILLGMLGLVLFTVLLVCGLFGVKMAYRAHLRHKAMATYEKGEYESAERLLLQYAQRDPDDEAVFVALADIYHEFGNVEMEAQMWQTASSLDPQNREYSTNMLTCAVKSASYAILHGILSRKAKGDEPLTDQELYLYVISSYRSGCPTDGKNAYNKYVSLDPDAFHKNDLGRMAEFVAIYPTFSDSEQDLFLSDAIQSEDPVIRFEAIYFAIRRLEQRNDDLSYDEEIERLLKLAVETNYYAGTPLLGDYYFSKTRFDDTIEVLEPYLKTIDDISLYLQYAESCAFTGRIDKLKELEKKLRQKTGVLPLGADYCEILIAYLENDKEKLAANVRKSGRHIDSTLLRFIRLRVAIENTSFSEILSLAKDIFSKPPFHDLHNRALLICLDYISGEMKKPVNQEDPSQMAELAKILSEYLYGNRLLTEIILMDQYNRNLVKEEYLIAAHDYFPDDQLLLRITAEHLIAKGKGEQALAILEQMANEKKSENKKTDIRIQFLLVLALDQVGQKDEAADVFLELLEQTEFNPNLLGQFFYFCLNNTRTEDLAAMADRLDAAGNEKTEHYDYFFRAAALLLSEDKSKEKEALDLLVASPTNEPELTFYAANCLCKHDCLEEAEAKYSAITKTYYNPSLIYVNLSIIYHAMGEVQKALEAAKTAFELEKKSMFPAFIYAKRLSEAKRYEDALKTLNFPHHAVDFRKDIIELWCECVHHVIEKSFTERKFLLVENLCIRLLIINPDDEFGKENLEKVRKILFPKKGDADTEGDEAGLSYQDTPQPAIQE